MCTVYVATQVFMINDYLVGSRRCKRVERVTDHEQYRDCRDYLTPPMHATKSVKSDSGLT